MHLNLGQNILFCFFHHTCLPLLQCLETTPVSFQINFFFNASSNFLYVPWSKTRGPQETSATEQRSDIWKRPLAQLPSKKRFVSSLGKKKTSRALRSVLSGKDKLTCVREAHYLILQNHRTMVIIPSNFHQSCPGLQKLLLNLMT